ncbi:MAG: hypothetical protein ACRYGA_00270 [Janthinobacterium lividum]
MRRSIDLDAGRSDDAREVATLVGQTGRELRGRHRHRLETGLAATAHRGWIRPHRRHLELERLDHRRIGLRGHQQALPGVRWPAT